MSSSIHRAGAPSAPPPENPHVRTDRILAIIKITGLALTLIGLIVSAVFLPWFFSLGFGLAFSGFAIWTSVDGVDRLGDIEIRPRCYRDWNGPFGSTWLRHPQPVVRVSETLPRSMFAGSLRDLPRGKSGAEYRREPYEHKMAPSGKRLT